MTSAVGSFCVQFITGAQNGYPNAGTCTMTAVVAGVSKSLEVAVR